MHFGIREHAMAAIINGMSLTKLRPFGATFFVFTDYMRGGLRLSALMGIPVIYILTHDSIGVGEDGPTHQPIEHLAIARATPGLIVLRPADANEVVEAWKVVMQLQHEPALLVLTRQAVPTLDRTRFASAAGLTRGAYVLADSAGASPDVLLLATGSEVPLCVEAYEQLVKEGIRARVVNMPSWELFERQDRAYRSASGRKSAGLSRNGKHIWLGPLRWSNGPEYRDAQLRRFRANQGAAKSFWLYGRKCDRRREGADSGSEGLIK
jgi:transketolase